MSKGKLVGNIVAVIVMLVVMGALGVRLWANQQRLDIPMIWNGALSADAQVHLVVGNDMHIESIDSSAAETLPLGRFGIREFSGDLLALPDGAFVLAAGRYEEMDFEEKLRKVNRERRHPEDASDYLQRCNFSTGNCELLSGDDSDAPVFRPGRAFGISKGPGNTLLAADASGHKVHLLAMDGRILDTIATGFEFPNEIHLVSPDEAMVVDTNHHRLVYFAVTENGFGEQLRDVSILDWPGVEGLQRFPFAWARTDDGAEWLLVAGNNMGSAILVRAFEGDRQEIELPAPADPVDFVVLPERLLLLDQGTDRILAFDHSGKPMRDFGSPGLQQQLAEHAAARSRYSGLMSTSLYVLVTIVVLGIPAAVFYLRQRYKSEARENAESIELKDGDSTSDSVALNDSSVMLSTLSGVYYFKRTMGSIDPGDRRRFIFLLMLLVLTLLSAQFFMLAESPNAVARALENLEPRKWAMALLAVVAMLIAWVYLKLEELRIDRSGIHYSSPLPGFLEFMQPDWSFSWEEVDDVSLTFVRTPKNPQMWRLIIVSIHGEERTLLPLQWSQVGAREPGIRLADLTRMTEGLIRRVIHQRMLFRVLATQLNRLREKRNSAN